jgi:hypothetical protein
VSKLAIHVSICFLPTPQSKSCWHILIGFSLIICASIIFDGKSLELTKQIKSNKEVFDCLEKFGLSNNDIKKVKKQTNNNRHVLRAVTNKCLRKLADETVDADDMRQFFINQLDEVSTYCNCRLIYC